MTRAARIQQHGRASIAIGRELLGYLEQKGMLGAKGVELTGHLTELEAALDAHPEPAARIELDIHLRDGLNLGRTQSELAEVLGLSPHQVNKRLADLHTAGRIRPTGETREGHAGRDERVWVLVR
jgi:hypothetical protein